MTQRTSQNGYDLIKHFEGCVLKSYLCPAKVWTVGVGHTGPEVKPGMEITQQQADKLLEDDLVKFERGVAKLVTVHLMQSQFDALVSFAFNLGLGALGSSTLLKMLNDGKYEAAAQQFLRWDKAGGKVLAGLTKRRRSERTLFEGEDWRKP